jgi:hypothetical protein
MPRHAFAAALCTLLGGAALAAPPAGQAQAAFERLAKLDGNWKSQAKDDVVFITWRVIANGAAVLETVSNADHTRVNSVTVYAVEGEELVASHFGAEVAHPRLALKVLDGGRLRFEVLGQDAPKDGKAAHVSALLLVVKGEDVVTLDWTTTAAGKGTRRSVELKREYLDTLK